MSGARPSWKTGEIPTDSQIDAWIRLQLARIPALRDRYNAVVFQPVIAPGSAAEADEASPFGKYVRAHGMNALGVGDEVLETWRQIYEADIRPITAYASILRTVLETATIARWLMDAAQPSSERVRRGILAHLEDLDERAGFEKAAPPEAINIRPPSLPGAAARDAVLADAAAHGIDVVGARGKRKPPIGYLDRCSKYAIAKGFEGEAAYRLVSCLAHGLPWSISVVRHEPIVEAPAPRDTTVSRVTANPDAIALVTTWGLDTFDAALSDAEHYLGAAEN